MELKNFFFAMSNEDREVFAVECGTSPGHMRNVAYGYKLPSTELAVAIEKKSKKLVTRQEMFPNTFLDKWPELRSKQKVGA